jgi:hypothetical protein
VSFVNMMLIRTEAREILRATMLRRPRAGFVLADDDPPRTTFAVRLPVAPKLVDAANPAPPPTIKPPSDVDPPVQNAVAALVRRANAP